MCVVLVEEDERLPPKAQRVKLENGEFVSLFEQLLYVLWRLYEYASFEDFVACQEVPQSTFEVDVESAFLSS